jgi:tRNA (cytidine/uridine-2'-O-)-methyltransferase
MGLLVHARSLVKKGMRVVLFEPEIPWNTGNVGRTCVAVGAELHLIEPLGFSLSERRLKRAGLDYWSHLACFRHESFDAFERTLAPGAALLAFSAQAQRSLWEAPIDQDSYLVFGRESTGLPDAVQRRCAGIYRVPMAPEARSLNLSTTVALALYEGVRRRQGT